MFLRCIPFWVLLLSAIQAFAEPAEEDRALAEWLLSQTSRSAEGLRQDVSGEGVSLDLDGRFRHAYIAELGEDGLRAACVGSLAEANHFFGRNLLSGKRLPQYPSTATSTAASPVPGISAEQYRFYWSLIEEFEQGSAQRAPEAATITIVNNDGAGEGFNDPTPVAPEGGNPGTTRGQQRINVFNQAASIWAAFLDSNVTISVRANFDPLTPCSSSGGVLGAAGATTLHRDFPNAALSNTFYPQALANKQRGLDLSAQPDIETVFNSSVDNGCLGAGTRFYYGYDNATPALRINLLVVVLHELGHGLGSASYTNESNGAFPGTPAAPDIWAHFQFDRSLNLLWTQMSAAQRQASAINVNNLLWNGANVRIASGFLTVGRDAQGRVELYTPNPLQLGSSVSHWNARVEPNLLMEPSINSGLPLTLDLTRQQMRDIGWYRDTTADLTPDTITNVQPSSGTLPIGSNVNISWSNTGGFNRNVTIELSLDGGSTFPTTIASNVANTGSRAWTVPNSPSAQARIRVREHDFVAPAGVSSGNFTIGSPPNTPPTFTPAAAISRQAGSPSGPAVVVGTVADQQTPAGSLQVSQVPGGSSSGMVVGSPVNNNGTVSATVAASCQAIAGTVRFQVSDGSLTGSGDLQVNTTPNTPPTLSYSNQSLPVFGNLMVQPASGPADNGSVVGIFMLSQGGFTGSVSVDQATGVVSLSNAGPIGVHALTVRAVDNCGANRDTSFQVSVVNTAPSFVPGPPVTRQQGSPGGAAVQIGTVSDAESPAGSLSVALISGGSATGITVSSLSNDNGTVSAVLSASCTASSGTLRFQAFDGNLAGTGNLQVDVLANTPPLLGSYADTQLAPGASTTLVPSAPPADNGSVQSLSASADPAGFSGSLTASLPSGELAIATAGPQGIYQVTLVASDNCGATAQTGFTLQVGTADLLFADGFE